ncbi:hypothetical protein [Actinomycetospora termitidis]|uniref:FHA domain-containing protein n=1 Tax=Actinomycetospora termitidis TaxID=3053470 RepID=A0ABT7MFE0_9PSEU|nr:hypothetical protein [Actinomycetospora sp. Odt1-22]MDL5158083.1 hypothetical protein [Actinomycetospora sp. Odt1-22]
MEPLYFRITERPDPARFEPGWSEIHDRLVLDRTVWRGDEVSRTSAGCVVLRADPEDGAWELRNRAEGRVAILHDGRQRYDVLTGMAITIRPGVWRGTLTEAFSFQLSTVRPPGIVRPVGGATGELEAVDGGTTRRRTPELRARTYLERYPIKRFGLAYLWRQHLGHTPDIARDLDPLVVGRAFGVAAKSVTRWREDLAEAVFLRRGYQQSVRDIVVKHGVMTHEDVVAADRYLADLRGDAS